jgi:hypothetical protein
MVGGVAGSVQNDTHAIPGGLLNILFFRHHMVTSAPLFRGETLHTVVEFLVHSRPRREKIWN